MSLYATIDDRPAGDVATSSGWSDFLQYVEHLNGVDELRHLTEYGWADEGEKLVVDISGAIREGSMTVDQRSIADGLFAIAKKMKPREVLTISDGTGVVERRVLLTKNGFIESIAKKLARN